MQPSAGGIKELLSFKKRPVLAISDAKGKLHLFDSGDQSSPAPIVSLEVDSKSEIKGMAVTASETYIAAGCVDGTITIFDLGAAGRERLAKQLVTLQGNKNVRCLQWREQPRRELIAGHLDGLVTVWDFR